MEAKLESSPSTPPPPAPAAPTEAKTERTRPNIPAAGAGREAQTAVSSVLGNGDLLREILLRLDFPTCLVRAAAVCKHWLRHASDQAFLRRFWDLHPPRLLGFYLTTRSYRQLEFVPLLPQPPELAAVLRRGRFVLDAKSSSSSSLDTDDEGSSVCLRNGIDCRNGRLFFSLLYRDGICTYGVHSPLHPARGVVDVPAPCHRRGLKDIVVSDVLSREVGDELSYFWFSFLCNKKGNATAYVHKLQNGTWQMNGSAQMKIPKWSRSKQSLRGFHSFDDKIIVVATTKYIVVFNLASSSFSTIKFPDGMLFNDAEIILSQGNDSGLYLVHLKGLKLSIWLHQDVNSSAGYWSFLDSFCLRDMCADLLTSNCETEDGNTAVVYLSEVGSNAEFIFLNTDACVFYLDVRSRELRKVYEITETQEEKDEALSYNIHICPFMMIWPPTFPVLNE